ncbi:TlyA family RNA methyltransferase [Nisaea denitrificans]|uniref:TlyA family RNA methyltransferase n=1 Tax=Nisaea denitrificans TaxID=390877 RepID=UPI0004208B8B|nr:TlyA family RNA methyltransferase [Nisaea denitrificans]
MASERLDLALVERGLAESRSRARHLIEAGQVTVDGVTVIKPAAKTTEAHIIKLDDGALKWASRAGLKLEHALDIFNIDPAGLVCLDIGASTGGFTDVLLDRGALRVHAVDVGHGQLIPRLVEDERVHVYERLNARYLQPEMIGEPVGLVVSDVSFISLRLALPMALACAAPGGQLVALVKPQFEVGAARIGKGGIVRDEAARADALRDVVSWLENDAGWTLSGQAESPIFGNDGNQEFLIAAEKP